MYRNNKKPIIFSNPLSGNTNKPADTDQKREYFEMLFTLQCVTILEHGVQSVGHLSWHRNFEVFRQFLVMTSTPEATKRDVTRLGKRVFDNVKSKETAGEISYPKIEDVRATYQYIPALRRALSKISEPVFRKYYEMVVNDFNSAVLDTTWITNIIGDPFELKINIQNMRQHPELSRQIIDRLVEVDTDDSLKLALRVAECSNIPASYIQMVVDQHHPEDADEKRS